MRTWRLSTTLLLSVGLGIAIDGFFIADAAVRLLGALVMTVGLLRQFRIDLEEGQ